MSARTAKVLAFAMCCCGIVSACGGVHFWSWRNTTFALVPAQLLILFGVCSLGGPVMGTVVGAIGSRTAPENRLRVVTAASAIAVGSMGVGYFIWLRLLRNYLAIS